MIGIRAWLVVFVLWLTMWLIALQQAVLHAAATGTSQSILFTGVMGIVGAVLLATAMGQDLAKGMKRLCSVCREPIEQDDYWLQVDGDAVHDGCHRLMDQGREA